MSHADKIKAALDLLAGCPQHVFAELAVLAADQAGLSKDEQDDLRSSLSCRVCGDAKITDRGLCFECEERDHFANRSAKAASKQRRSRGDNEDYESPDEYAGLSRRDAAYYAGGENWRGE